MEHDEAIDTAKRWVRQLLPIIAKALVNGMAAKITLKIKAGKPLRIVIEQFEQHEVE